MSVFCDSRSILENASSLLALSGDHLGNPSLTDDGIAVTSDTRVHKQLINVPQTHCLAVDKIFTVSCAVIPSRYRYLIVRAIQFGKIPSVVKGYRNLGVSHRTAAVCTAEYNVLHFASAQALG